MLMNPHQARVLSLVPGVVALVLLATKVSAAQVSTPFVHAEAVSTVIEREMARQRIAGLALAIIDKGAVTYLQGYGLADVERNVPVSEKTLFNWASISKPLMAVRVLQLVQAGKLDLDTSILVYLPTLPDHLEPVTPRHLLCHQSGIPHYANGKIIGDGKRHHDKDLLDPQNGIGRFINSPLIHPPGERVSYSSYAYLLLSAVVQKVGRAPLGKQLQQDILGPLNMHSFTLDTADTQREPNWAVGYIADEGGRGFELAKDWPHFWKHGAGGYKSTIGDLAAFAVGLMNGKLLAPKTMKAFTGPQSLNDGTPTNYGLGIIVLGSGKNLQLVHNGAQSESRTRLVIWPHQQRGIVLMCNVKKVDPNQITKALRKVVW